MDDARLLLLSCLHKLIGKCASNILNRAQLIVDCIKSKRADIAVEAIEVCIAWTNEPNAYSALIDCGAPEALEMFYEQHDKSGTKHQHNYACAGYLLHEILRKCEDAGELDDHAQSFSNLIDLLAHKVSADFECRYKDTISLVQTVALICKKSEQFKEKANCMLKDMIHASSFQCIDAFIRASSDYLQAAIDNGIASAFERTLKNRMQLSQSKVSATLICICVFANKSNEKFAQLHACTMPHIIEMLHASDDPTWVIQKSVSAAFEIAKALSASGASGINLLKEYGFFDVIVALMVSDVKSGKGKRKSGITFDMVKYVLAPAAAVDEVAADVVKIIKSIIETYWAKGELDPYHRDTLKAFYASKIIGIIANSNKIQLTSIAMNNGIIPRLLNVLYPSDNFARQFAFAGYFCGNALLRFSYTTQGRELVFKSGGLKMMVETMGEAPSYWAEKAPVALQAFTTALENVYRDDLLKAGLLDKLAPFINAGPSCGRFVFSVSIISNIFMYGTHEQVEQLRGSEVINTCIKFMDSGHLDDETLWNRPDKSVLKIIGFTATNPASRAYIKKIIANINDKDAAVSAKFISKLYNLLSSYAFEGASVAVEEQAIQALVSVLTERYDEDALQCLAYIAEMIPEAVGKTKEAIKEARHIIERRYESAKFDQSASSAAKILGACALCKPSWNKHILLSVVGSIEEDIDEKRMCVIAQILKAASFTEEGARVIQGANIVEKLLASFDASKSKALKINILQLFNRIATRSLDACTKLGEGSTPHKFVDLLRKGLKDDEAYSVGKGALSILCSLSEQDALRPALRATEPLEVLASVCEHKSSERNNAIFLIANLYSESTSVVTRKEDKDKKLILKIFADYHIEKEVMEALKEGCNHFKYNPLYHVYRIQKILTVVRSMVTNADLRKSLYSEGIVKTLQLALLLKEFLSGKS